MPNTASASLSPWTCAIPQSSRVIVTRDASARHFASSGGAAAVRRNRSGAKASLSIGQGLLRLSPTRKQLRVCAIEQLIDVADAEVVAAVIFVELFPGDGRRHRRAFATARRIRH